MSIKLIDFQQAQHAIQRELSKFKGGKFATVGIHESAGVHPGSHETNAQIGAKVNYGDETNTLNGHHAPIPSRPWLIPGVKSATQDIIDVVAEGLENGTSLDMILEQVGAVSAGATQQYMTDLKEPPNAPYTIEQKGSDNPLIDTGYLRSSVTWKVDYGKPEEGI